MMNFKYYCKTEIIFKMGILYYKRIKFYIYIQSRANYYKYEGNLISTKPDAT